MKTLVAFALALFSSLAFAQPPTLGADCGVGATLTGNEKAGHVILGDISAQPNDLCTLTFAAPFAKTPTCAASNETNGGGWSAPLGTISSKTQVIIGGAQSWSSGDTIDYLCVAP